MISDFVFESLGGDLSGFAAAEGLEARRQVYREDVILGLDFTLYLIVLLLDF